MWTQPIPNVNCRVANILTNLQFNSQHSLGVLEARLTMKRVIRKAGMQQYFFKYCTIQDTRHKTTQFVYRVAISISQSCLKKIRSFRTRLSACNLISSMKLLTQPKSKVITWQLFLNVTVGSSEIRHTNMFKAKDEVPYLQSLLSPESSSTPFTDRGNTVRCVLSLQTIDQPSYTVIPLPTVTDNL